MPSSQSHPRFAALKTILAYIGLPLMFFAAGTALLVSLGLMQRFGWLSPTHATSGGTATANQQVDYICPMMCVPAVKEAGRCPVCAMELVPATAGAAGGDERSIVVDPASRRVANIQTVSVKQQSVNRTVRSVGELHYDESGLKTLTAYSAGRIERLFVDFTGAKVSKDDRLATIYSPQLHSAAVEYLQAVRANSGASRLDIVAAANRSLKENARQKLIELGMSPKQIETLESTGNAQSRVEVSAPLAGTVIERLVSEGQSVNAGEPLFRLADLSSVWLLLELFPEDAAAVRYGQRVTATVKSIPGEEFSGRIAFVDPNVNPQTRTVNVRVVIENTNGRLRIGDYAKAEVSIPFNRNPDSPIYDPELAGKWISARHPHVVRDEPGTCPVCGEPLVAATKLGFADEPQADVESFVVPRNAVLQAAGQSVVYVEEEPGRFAIRRVITGATDGTNVVIERGIAADEKVAVGGNFLLDSQMQLAGNPSLIDPTRAAEPLEMIAGFDATELAAIQMLPDDEQPSAIEQVICPVTKYKLGSMGVPPKATIDGTNVYLCCEGCRMDLMKDPQGYLAMLQKMKSEGTLHQADDQESSMPDLPDFGPIEAIEDASLPLPGPIESIDDEISPAPAVDSLPPIAPIEPATKSPIADPTQDANE